MILILSQSIFILFTVSSESKSNPFVADDDQYFSSSGLSIFINTYIYLEKNLNKLSMCSDET